MRFMLGKEMRLVKRAKQSKNWIVRQAELKTELDIREKEDTIIVEKSNMIKFLIQTIGIMIRIAAEITIITFALIGIAAVVYPEPRADLIIIMKQMISQITSYF